MRSKCRCSCVLQFTFCHAFSSVLHRPPSQLIHCIALFLVVSLEAKKKLEKNMKLLRRQGADDGAARLSIRIPGGIVIEPSRHEKKIFHCNTTTEQRPYGGRQAPGLLDTPPHHHETWDGRGGNREFCLKIFSNKKSEKSLMILPQVHLRKPCYDFYFL